MPAEMLLGRYRLSETAQSGGFSTVQIAWDTRLQRRVAVKRIALIGSGGSAAQDGLLEARTAALLSDPNIVSVLDFEVLANEALIIMEYVDGPNLATLMRAATELFDLPSVAAIAQDVGGALSHAHENQVLHLDIKPANILFNAKGQAKVTDFGMALLSAQRGFGPALGGTVGYMPPEQIYGMELDERTDLWALAILLYQLLVGFNPYLVGSTAESLELMESTGLPLPSQQRPDLNAAVDRLFVRSLDPDREERPRQVTDFLTALLPELGSPRSGHAALHKRLNSWQQTTAGGSPATAPEPALAELDLSADGADLSDEFAESWSPARPAAAVAAQTAAPNQEELRDISTSGGHWALPESVWSQFPIWQRLSPATQSRWSRLLALLVSLATATFGLSGFGFFGWGGGGLATGEPWQPVGGSLANNAGAGAAGGTAFAGPSLEIQLIIFLAILVVVALVALIAPPLGSLLALLIVGAGVLGRGLVILGVILLLATLVWWFSCGRRGWAEAICVPLVIPLSWGLAVCSLPLLIGTQQRPARALVNIGSAWLLALGVAGLSWPLYSNLLPSALFSGGFILVKATQQFPWTFWNLLTAPFSWLSLATWLLAGAVMLLFSRQRQLLPPARWLLSTGAVLSTVLQAAIWIVVLWLWPNIFAGNRGLIELAGYLAVQSAVALVLTLVLIRLGVLSGWSGADSARNREAREI